MCILIQELIVYGHHILDHLWVGYVDSNTKKHIFAHHGHVASVPLILTKLILGYPVESNHISSRNHSILLLFRVMSGPHPEACAPQQIVRLIMKWNALTLVEIDIPPNL